MMMFLLFGMTMTDAAPSERTASAMSWTDGLFVCPPPTTRAPRPRNALVRPYPLETATRPVFGASAAPMSTSARISECCSDMSSTFERTIVPYFATIARSFSGSSVWMWPLTKPSAPTTSNESPKGATASWITRVSTVTWERRNSVQKPNASSSNCCWARWVTVGGGGSGAPSNAAITPSSRRRNPSPPASTTPACLRMGRSSGVRSSERRPASKARCRRATGGSSAAAPSTASADSRTTVRMVPSTGFMTAA
jgi:hypothetical protein